MESQEIVKKSGRRQRREKKAWSKLRLRMTISYVVVSVVSALLVELLLASLFFLVILRLPFVDSATLSSAKS
ncbi:MAG TPA: hypothetical protein VJO32_02270, partial [Ktedonobacteraceae bacterium]|nr:hypothetical protein [Ktedonobacteraceae bacterium]